MDDVMNPTNSPSGETNDTLLVSKFSAAFIIALITFCAFALNRVSTTVRRIWLLFAASLLFGLAFMHLIPESTEKWHQQFPSLYPVPSLLTVLTFFSLFSIDFFKDGKSEEQALLDSAMKEEEEEEEAKDVNEEGDHHHHISHHDHSDCHQKPIKERRKRKSEDEEGFLGAEKKTTSDDDDNTQAVSFLFIMVGHSFLEGMMVGICDDTFEVIALSIGVFVHKPFMALAVLLLLTSERSSLSTLVYVSLFSLFAMAFPLGVIFSVLLSTLAINHTALDICSVLVSSVASGSFLYVSWTILNREFHQKCPAKRKHLGWRHGKLVPFIALIAGISIASLFPLLVHLLAPNH